MLQACIDQTISNEKQRRAFIPGDSNFHEAVSSQFFLANRRGPFDSKGCTPSAMAAQALVALWYVHR